MGQAVSQGDDHRRHIGLRSASGEMADGSFGIKPESGEDEIDAVLLKRDRSRMLAYHPDIGAAAVGLVHCGDRGSVGIDTKISHIKGARDIGVMQIGEASEQPHQAVQGDIAGAGVEVLLNRFV